MGKIGDLWVKLGLKKDDFEKGLDQAERRLDDFSEGGGGVKSVLGKLKGAWVAYAAAIVASLAKAYVKMKLDTNKFGDTFKSTTEGLKNAWKSFTTALLNFDFKDLANRIKSAFKAGKEGYDAADMEDEWNRSIEIRKHQLKDQLDALRATAKNEKLTLDERIDAQRKYNEIVAKLALDEKNARVRSANAEVDLFLTKNGGKTTAAYRNALPTLFSDIVPDKDLLNILAKRGNGRYLTEDEQATALKAIKRNGYDDATVEALIKLSAIYQNASNEDLDKVFSSIQKGMEAKESYDAMIQQLGDMADSITKKPDNSRSPRAPKEKEPKLKTVKFRKDNFRFVDMSKELKEFNRELEREEQQLDKEIQEIRIDLSELASPVDWASNFQEYSDWIMEMAEVTEDASKQIKDALINGFADGIQTLMDGLMKVEQFDAKHVLAALLTPMADTCITIGKEVLGVGLAIDAFKESIKSMNPYVAIAAGTALIAIGTAAKAAIQSSLNGSGGGGSAASSASSGSSSPDWLRDTELHIVVDTYATGSTIESVVNSERRKNNR